MLGFDINIRYVPDFPVGGLTFFIGVTLSSRLTFPIYGEKSEPENRICVCNAAAAATRVEGIPGNNFFPVPGIPGYSGKNSREFPGIQNSLHRKQKTPLLLWKLNCLNVF